jgi:cysteine desulfurase family protein
MTPQPLIYLDNAATAWPKPEKVYETADRVLRRSGNPGRSGHRLSLEAGKYIEETRFLLARFFHAPAPANIVFTLNTTDALNLAIKGLTAPGDHVITGSMEHNSVARPLETLKAAGLVYTKVTTDMKRGTDPDEVKRAFRKNTKLVVVNHVSNVTGTENPIAEIAALCRERGVLFLLDAAQSAGYFPIDLEATQIDLMAFPGHKGLLGPQGTGGLYIRDGLELRTLREGGTGTHSEDLAQPSELPSRYESGTANTAGIAALGEGVRYVTETGLGKIADTIAVLTNRLIEALTDIKGIRIYGPPPGPARRGVVSVTLDAMDSAQAALILDNSFNIAVRSGLHCAPDAHRTLGTLAIGGTVRISVGHFTTEQDIDACVAALRELGNA